MQLPDTEAKSFRWGNRSDRPSKLRQPAIFSTDFQYKRDSSGHGYSHSSSLALEESEPKSSSFNQEKHKKRYSERGSAYLVYDHKVADKDVAGKRNPAEHLSDTINNQVEKHTRSQATQQEVNRKNSWLDLSATTWEASSMPVGFKETDNKLDCPTTKSTPSSRRRFAFDIDDIKGEEEDEFSPPNRFHTQSPVLHAKRLPPNATDAKPECRDCKRTPVKDSVFRLELQESMGKSNDASHEFSSSGTLTTAGFRIRQSGLSAPVFDENQPLSIPSEHPGDYGNGDSEVNKATRIPGKRKQVLKLDLLGRGSSGVVHKAFHIGLLALVAIKVMAVHESEKRHQLVTELKTLHHNFYPGPKKSAYKTKAESRMIHQSKASGQSPHERDICCPEVVRLFDAFMSPNDGTVAVVFEYMPKGSIQDVVDAGGIQDEVVLAQICSDILKALAFLHSRRLLHRDIKPSNLLIHRKGVKLADFGIAKEMSGSVTKATTFVGTMCYMSPERISGEAYSYESDIWSFGLTVLACALGRFPYGNKVGYWELLGAIRNHTPPDMPSGISSTFKDFLSKCLEQDPEYRWSASGLQSHPFLSFLHDKSSRKSFESSLKNMNNCPERDVDIQNLQELENLVTRTSEYYKQEAEDRIHQHLMRDKDIEDWIEDLPANKKENLVELSDQLSLSVDFVHAKFQDGLQSLLLALSHVETRHDQH